MALFTGKGDDGTTKIFGCDQRISKGSALAEALGALDEANSFLGLVKVKSNQLEVKMSLLEDGFNKIIDNIQQNLFIIQAEVAGSDMSITEEKLRRCEDYISEGEGVLPPIKTFFVSGGSELSVLFDIARTLVRKAERRVVYLGEDRKLFNNKRNLAYLNRLSSLLYVLARLANHFNNVVEDAPSYN